MRRLALPAGNSGIACRQSLVCSLSDAATAITHTLPLPLPTAAAAATAAATVAALLTPDTCSGSLAVAAAHALHLAPFSHLHWLPMHAAAGLAAAAPGLALELGLLTAALLPSRRGASTGSDSDNTICAGDIARLAAARMHAHTLRYDSHADATATTAPLRSAALAAAAALSQELLLRGVLLAGGAAWLTGRLIEAGVCGTDPTTAHGVLDACSGSSAWVVAGGICLLAGARHAAAAAAADGSLASAADAAAAAAAARARVLRYEPRMVQEEATAAATAAAAAATISAGATGSTADGSTAAAASERDVSRLLHILLGARCVVGQASAFAAYLFTDDLAASLVTGLVLSSAAGAAARLHALRTSSTKALL